MGRRLGYLSGALRVSTRPDAEASGPRTHVVGFLRAAERCGWDVHRFVVGDTPAAQRLAPAGRAEAVRGSRAKQAATDALRLAAGVRNRRQAWRELGGSVDLVYERFASFQALGAAFQRRGVPWVLETQGPYFHEAKQERGAMVLTGPARRIELGAYRRCDLLVCVSEPLRALLVELGVPESQTFVLPNGVDPERFDARPPMASDRLTVGFVGTVRRWQGVDTLVEAVALARGRGVPVGAVVVGDGPDLDALRALAVARGGGDHISFPGRVPADEVPSHLASVDLGFSGHLPLLGGHMYHSPLKLYEYLAMGKPLLAADHPEARSLVEETGAGALFPAGDAAALADVLEAIDVDAVRAASTRVRSVVLERHSWDARLQALEAELARRGL